MAAAHAVVVGLEFNHLSLYILTINRSCVCDHNDVSDTMMCSKKNTMPCPW